MRSLGVLIVRLVVGGLLAGHGAQKLFGWFGGAGLEGTAGWLESLRLRPGTVWARVAGGTELGGGLLTALGLLNPLGPIIAMGPMTMAWAKVHLGNPVWVTKGGAELPLTNLSVLAAVSIAGPGRLSLDSLLGIRVPRRVGLVALLATLGAVYASARREIEAGTATIADVSQEAEGGPATAAEERADVAMAAETASAGDGSQGSAGDVYAWTGLSGADAGTSMGSGSDLGSETPQTI